MCKTTSEERRTNKKRNKSGKTPFKIFKHGAQIMSVHSECLAVSCTSCLGSELRLLGIDLLLPEQLMLHILSKLKASEVYENDYNETWIVAADGP